MITKLEMPANGSGSGSSTLLAAGGTPTTSRLLTSVTLPVKSEEPSAAQSSPGSSILSQGTAFGLPNASPPHENGTLDSDDLGPVARDRCNTWPLRRPQLDLNAQTSPLIHEQIPEEENDMPSPVPCGGGSGQLPPSSAGSDTSDPGSGAPGSSKKSTTRRNAWGNMSYADLITQAIVSSPEKRLTLSQVYEWMVQNVPYFRDKGDSNSSAGWKNSIRHNLSLHSRFMRIQNEGAGKSSWWVINPDAKPGRNPRRQRSATLETSTKAAMEKKRRGARKKVLEMRAGGALHSASSSVVGSQASIISRELYGDNDDSLGNFEPMFRPRTQSNLSIPGSSSRVSPSMAADHFDDFDFPPFVEAGAMPHDILDRTNEITLSQNDSPAFHRALGNPVINGSSTSAPPPTSALLQQVKAEPLTNGIKSELNGVQPPPSYHELNAVRGVSQLQNPLLRTHLIQNRLPPPAGLPYNGLYSSASPGLSNWIHASGTQLIPAGIHPSCAAQQTLGPTALPMDLENLTLPDQPLMEFDNMEAVLRHELSQSASNQLSFDNI